MSFSRTSFLGTMNDALENMQIGFAIFCMVAFIVVVFIEIASRSIWGQAFVWTQDAAMFLFLWSVFVAAPVAFRHDQHLQIEVLSFTPNTRAARVHVAILTVLNLLFASTYAYLTWKVLTARLGRIVAATGWPLEIGYASILVMAVSSLFYLSERLLLRLSYGESPRPERLKSGVAKEERW